MGKPSKIVISSRKIINWDDLCDFCWVVKGSSAKYIQIWETWFNRWTNKKPYKDGDGIPMCIQVLKRYMKRCWFKLLDLHENIWRQASCMYLVKPKVCNFPCFYLPEIKGPKSGILKTNLVRGWVQATWRRIVLTCGPKGPCENSPPSFPLRMGHPLADLKERNISS